MKKPIWADPKKEWDGFRFTAYSLDWKRIEALPITQMRIADGKKEETSLTVGDVLKTLSDREFDIEPGSGIGYTTFRKGSEELTYKGPAFSVRLLAELGCLHKENISAFESVWYWYDSDSCRDDPHEMYAFFVVSGDRIVRESVSFSDHHGSGFDPDVFETYDDSNSIWDNDEAWSVAQTRYWYRKFYTETRTGQLMVLRDDNPMLYDYQPGPGPGLDDTALLVNIFGSLQRIRNLLLVLIGLVILLAILIWE